MKPITFMHKEVWTLVFNHFRCLMDLGVMWIYANVYPGLDMRLWNKKDVILKSNSI